jgi:uncharacterized protein YndB with AHSA1/START domain/effector-binding domain-containing protein
MLFFPESFNVSTPTDRSIEIARDFNAPRRMVFDAFTKPDLVRQWLLGPDGWTMPVCEIDLRVGGRYRYVWRKEATGTDMGMGGVFREIIRPEKLVATEKFDDAWYPGEAVNTTIFAGKGEITTVTLTVLYESTDARDTAARSGMERGMAAGYNRLEELLSSLPAADGTPHLADTPVIAETPPQLAAAIRLTVPRNQIQSVMGPGLTEIMTAVKGQGIGPTGPWFTHHLKMSPATFDFEICVPVSAPVTPVGRVVNREIPAVRVAQAIYQGSYEGLADGWREFDGWMTVNGHVPGPDLYECYTVGPESSTDAAQWRTELRRPVLDR